jgi:peptidylprolyl isomerase
MITVFNFYAPFGRWLATRAFVVMAILVPALAVAAEAERSNTQDVIERVRRWLPGEFEGAIPAPEAAASDSPQRLRHQIVRVPASSLGEEVYYHEIAVGPPEATRIFQRKLYVVVMDASSVKTRVWLLPAETRSVASHSSLAEAVASELAELDLATLPSFPEGCEIHWSLEDEDTLIARVTPDRCRYFSAAFATDIFPDMTYRITINDFSMRDRLLNAEGKDQVPDVGLMKAERAPSTTSEVVSMTTDADWRAPNAENLLVMKLAAGPVVIELAPEFAPKHVHNILKLVQQKWFDGLTINRVQDNFVVQWGDPDNTRDVGDAERSLAPEFTLTDSSTLNWRYLPDGDLYAKKVGWAEEFPAALDPQTGAAWLAHCYGTVGVGRDNAADSGNGAELYAVIGHAPRQLDQNITVVGRILSGMELLSALPRGSGPLGFYERVEERVSILSIRQASQLPVEERPLIQVLKTTRPIFDRLVESRRNRRDSWYLQPAGHVDLCAISLPTRVPLTP